MNNDKEFIEKICQEIESSCKDIAPDHKAYSDILLALANSMNEEGREYAHRICRYWSQKDGYQPEKVDKDYDYALKNCDGGNGLGSVYHYFEKAGLTFPNTYGRANAEKEARRNARKEGREKESKRWAVQHLKDFLTTQAQYRTNAITEKAEIKWNKGCEPADETTNRQQTVTNNGWREYHDRDTNTLWARASEQGYMGNRQKIENIINSDFAPNYNPIADYLNSLPAWDGVTDHIKAELADRVELADNSLEERTFFEKCLKKWFVAMVANVYGKSVNQTMLIFTGPQGIYKSTYFQRLLPPQLRMYQSNDFSIETLSKDDKQCLHQNMLIHIDEMDCLKSKQLNQLKSIIQQPKTNLRKAYGVHTTEHLRIASFSGTSNHDHILTDTTGNRRFLTFKVTAIESPIEHPFLHDGMFAQAVSLLNQGFQYWFDGTEVSEVNKHNEQFEQKTPEEELIDKRYRVPSPHENYLKLTATEVLHEISCYGVQNLSNVRVGRALQKLGFERKRSNGTFCYPVVERPNYEQEERKKGTPQSCQLSQEDNSAEPF